MPKRGKPFATVTVANIVASPKRLGNGRRGCLEIQCLRESGPLVSPIFVRDDFGKVFRARFQTAPTFCRHDIKPCPTKIGQSSPSIEMLGY